MGKLTITLLSILLGLAFFSCTSSDDVINTLKDQYFIVDKAKFNEKSLPVGKTNSLSLSEFQTNSKVINGNSSIISLQSNEPLETIYIGVKGQAGFYSLDTEKLEVDKQKVKADKGEVYKYSFPYVTALESRIKEFTLQVSAKFEDESISKMEEQRVEIITVGVGNVQVTLTWDLPDDVDLYVTTPSKEVVYFYDPELRYKDETQAVFGELDGDSNAACDIDGINKENIFLTNAPVGVYTVGVSLYQKCKENPTDVKYSLSVYSSKESLNLSDKMTGVLVDKANGVAAKNEVVVIGYFEIKEDRSIVVANAPLEKGRTSVDWAQLVKEKY